MPTKMWAIVKNDAPFLQHLTVPSAMGDFNVAAVFKTRGDADIALSAIENKGYIVAEVDVLITGQDPNKAKV